MVVEVEAHQRKVGLREKATEERALAALEDLQEQMDSMSEEEIAKARKEILGLYNEIFNERRPGKLGKCDLCGKTVPINTEGRWKGYLAPHDNCSAGNTASFTTLVDDFGSDPDALESIAEMPPVGHPENPKR